MLDLHKFIVAISHSEVNHDGNGDTAPGPMTWDKGSIINPRASSLRVIVDHASPPRPPGELMVQRVPFPITQGGCSCFGLTVVTFFLEFTSFLATLHWPHGAAD